MIPKEISREYVLAAIAETDRAGVRIGRESTKYRLLYQGKAYPSKLVISVAVNYAIGREWPSEKWQGLEKEMPFVERYLGTGAYR